MPLIEILSAIALPMVVFILTQPVEQSQTKSVDTSKNVKDADTTASPEPLGDLFLSNDFGIEEIIAQSRRDT